VTASTVALVPTGSLTASATLLPFPSSTYEFPSGAVIATAISVSVFLSVLVLAVAFITWYRVKVKVRKLEVTQREHSADGSLRQPTAVDNLTDGMELHTLNAQTNRDSMDTVQRDASARSEENIFLPREGVV
jgi:hypothetical protein